MPSQICPNCGHENSKKAAHCRNCNAILSTVVKQADMDEERDALLDQTVHIRSDLITSRPSIKPADENQHVNSAAEVLDSALVTSTVNIEYDDDSESQFGGLMIAGDLILTHEASNTVFRIPQDQLDEVVIGRKHLRARHRPDSYA